MVTFTFNFKITLRTHKYHIEHDRIYNVVTIEQTFTVDPRYDVYGAPFTSSNYFRLQGNGESFIQAVNSFDVLNTLSDFKGSYFALQGLKYKI